MDEKTTAAIDDSTSSLSAPFEETPWLPQDRIAAEPDAATEAAVLLLSEAAHHSFRLEPLVEAGIVVARF